MKPGAGTWSKTETKWRQFGQPMVQFPPRGLRFSQTIHLSLNTKGFFFFSCLHKNVEHWSSCYLPRRIIRNVLLLSHMHCCTWQVNSLEVLLGFLTLFFAICNLLVIVCCKAKNQMGGMTESSTFYEIMILFHQE